MVLGARFRVERVAEPRGVTGRDDDRTKDKPEDGGAADLPGWPRIPRADLPRRHRLIVGWLGRPLGARVPG
ncbi:hypothetical protein GCM10010303_40860 [Streptomyces purpurascens]|nr:hypothetical protein GCM10010303_40860 [Streptomyces purpurascens]